MNRSRRDSRPLRRPERAVRVDDSQTKIQRHGISPRRTRWGSTFSAKADSGANESPAAHGTGAAGWSRILPIMMQAPPAIRAAGNAQKVLPGLGKNKTRRDAAGSKEQTHQGADVTFATYASCGD